MVAFFITYAGKISKREEAKGKVKMSWLNERKERVSRTWWKNDGGIMKSMTVDLTEHLHIVYIKTPHKNTKGHDYPPQICHNLDCQEKCWYFNLTTKLQATISTDPYLVSDPDRIFDTQTNNDKDWKL